ncbi:MAG: methionine--tRNA ligase [Clostridia bacterium]|nr:methionine--tRNA ligase [Clostridia bacterium]
MEKKKILVTSALLYVNGLPHLGHVVGCWLPGDVFKRFHKTYGNDVVYVSGTDDHGTTSYISAKEAGMEPSDYIAQMNGKMKKIAEKLCIDFDIFSGTNTQTHKDVTIDFFNEIYKNGYTVEQETNMLFCEHDKVALADRFVYGECPYCGYDKAYGDQCDKCGKTYELDELKNPKCSFCGKDAVKKTTKHIYISLDKLQPQLQAWVESKKDIWRPHVYSMTNKWFKEGLKPRCITRDIPWGIKVPLEGYEDKVFYVWFDAPIGYISITKELGGDEMVKDRWQNKDCEIYNFIGKDNIDFHAVFFPSMELACKKYNLAENVVGFNFLNFEGQKFSKSKKIGIFCDSLFDSDIDIDALRAYLVSIFPENKDSDFTYEGFKLNTNAELVGKYGNFFNRTLNMINKNFAGELAIDFEDIKNDLNENDNEMVEAITTLPGQIADLFAKTEFRAAYKEILRFASIGNTYLEKSAPWTLIKNGDIEGARKVLYLCLNMAKSLAIVASPIMPNRTTEIWTEQLAFAGTPADADKWEDASKINVSKTHKVNLPKPLFARIDDETIERYKATFSK